MLAIFAGIALLLALVGLCAVVVHMVRQRKHEIGVRIALGASRFGILHVVFAPVATVLIAAGLAGCAIPARRAKRVDPAVTLRHE